jgi:hydrogenase maturation protease
MTGVARVLVAGIGNVFLGDDGFGVAVVQQLLQRDDIPDGVAVADFGIRGFDLAYEMLNRREATILVDAVPRGEPPGTVMVIDADPDSDTHDESPAAASDHEAFQGHAMTPAAVFRLVRTLGGEPGRVLVIGCEPESFGEPGVGRMGLSDTAERAVPAAVAAVLEVVHSLVDAPAPSRETADA